VESVDHDIQCLLCDRVVAEYRQGRLRLNPHYGRDARAALAARRCGYCGGRLVGFPALGQWAEQDFPLIRRSHPRRLVG
jgi:hypothetical protein